jgi:hypothetical protein
MTQESRPVGQHIDNYPNGDSGPYSSAQWRALFSLLFTSDPTTQGPVPGYENELAVTNPSGKTIRVASGAGIVNGNVFFNDDSVDFTPSTPAGSARYDRVVICLNETSSTYSTDLEFPDSLTDYNGASSIQAYACRLAILTGAEGGGAPSLVQTANQYMVPLAQYQISTSGVVSSLTDQRTFAGSPGSMRTVFIPSYWGYNTTDNTAITPYGNNNIVLKDAKQCYAQGIGQIPSNYAGGGVIYPVGGVIYPVGSDMRAQITISGGGCGESISAWNTNTGWVTETISVSVADFICVPSLSLPSGAEAGDFFVVQFYRSADFAADTLGVDTDFYGFYLAY